MSRTRTAELWRGMIAAETVRRVISATLRGQPRWQEKGAWGRLGYPIGRAPNVLSLSLSSSSSDNAEM